MVVEVPIPQTDRNAGISKPKRYAVVVGINDYTEASVGNLSFCVADAEAFYDALLTYCEYDRACITLFSDGSHTDARIPIRSDILVAIADMSARATAEESILFFLPAMGHGTPRTATC